MAEAPPRPQAPGGLVHHVQGRLPQRRLSGLVGASATTLGDAGANRPRPAPSARALAPRLPCRRKALPAAGCACSFACVAAPVWPLPAQGPHRARVGRVLQPLPRRRHRVPGRRPRPRRGLRRQRDHGGAAPVRTVRAPSSHGGAIGHARTVFGTAAVPSPAPCACGRLRPGRWPRRSGGVLTRTLVWCGWVRTPRACAARYRTFASLPDTGTHCLPPAEPPRVSAQNWTSPPPLPPCVPRLMRASGFRCGRGCTKGFSVARCVLPINPPTPSAHPTH